ncbi:phage integrase N-terminal SAM-like domain-containing protein [Paraglaciecola sp.]|uniref:phage integrase N-terminal SAM-like domain-containing protein n=1 Tax=Paraglaciecola sp. TaxID=1920173 RepID=UPI003EF16AA0
MKTKYPYLQYINDYMLIRRFSLKTIESYLKWSTSFIHYHQKRHPASMGDNEVETYIFLVLKGNLSYLLL